MSARRFLLGTAMLALACAGEPRRGTEDAGFVRMRWLDEEPREPFSLVALVTSTAGETSNWKHRWRQLPSSQENVDAVAGARTAPPLRLRYRDELDADAIGALELHTTARLKRPPTLSWSSGSGCAAADATLAAVGAGRVDGESYRYVLAPLFDSCWSGKLRRVELLLDWSGLEGGEPVSIRAVGRETTLAHLRELSRTPRRIDLAGEVRSGLALLAGSSRSWTAEIPRDAVLGFAYGGDPSCRTPSRLRLRLIADAASSATLFEAEINPGLPAFGRWVEARVDLGPWSGKSVELELSIEGAASSAPASPGFAFFADAEITSAATRADAEPPSVVVVSVDTLRADRLSLYGNSRPTSPLLDRWAAANAVVFEQAIVQAPWTLPSHASLLSGLEPLRHGANPERPAGEALVTLAEQLRAAGYRTIAVTGGAWLGPRFGLDQGFDVFSYSPSQDERDAELERGVARALELVVERPLGPQLLFFHTYHVHGPHRARAPHFESWSRSDRRFRVADRPSEPDPVTGRKPNGPPELLRGGGRGFEPLPAELASLPYELYDSAVAEMDEQVARLIAEVKRRLGARRTIVVFTSDHGESLGEDGLGGHNNLREEVLRVPLVVEFPDQSWRSGRVRAQVRSIDVVPTLLEAVGLDPSQRLDGASLEPLARDPRAAVDRPAWSYTATGPWGLALRLAGRARYELSLSPWGEERGRAARTALSSPTGSPAARIAAAFDPGDRTQDAMVRRVRELGQGLFATLAACRDEPVEIELGIGSVERGAVKLLGAATRRPPEPTARGLLLALAPAERVEIWIEALASREISLRGRMPLRDALWTEATAAPAAPVELRLSAGRWASTASRAAPDGQEPLVRLFWRTGDSSPPAQLSDEAAAQLRALGYLQ